MSASWLRYRCVLGELLSPEALDLAEDALAAPLRNWRAIDFNT